MNKYFILYDVFIMTNIIIKKLKNKIKYAIEFLNYIRNIYIYIYCILPLNDNI